MPLNEYLVVSPENLTYQEYTKLAAMRARDITKILAALANEKRIHRETKDAFKEARAEFAARDLHQSKQIKRYREELSVLKDKVLRAPLESDKRLLDFSISDETLSMRLLGLLAKLRISTQDDKYSHVIKEDICTAYALMQEVLIDQLRESQEALADGGSTDTER